MSSVATILPISIVIPTYSEEKTLPILLESIQSQLFQPAEVIVADSPSTDKTREIALKYGAKVVEGGKIAFGRNAGARAAQSELILFMDADTKLPSELTLVSAYLEFMQRQYDIASAHYDIIKEESTPFGIFAGYIVTGLWNLAKIVGSLIKNPTFEGGAFILMKKSVFEQNNGFDEKLTMWEERDFFRRVVKNGGKYGSLHLNVKTSSRRFDTPEKFAKSILWGILETVLIAGGVYVGSKFFKKKASQYYGRLGGGEGKDPQE